MRKSSKKRGGKNQRNNVLHSSLLIKERKFGIQTNKRHANNSLWSGILEFALGPSIVNSSVSTLCSWEKTLKQTEACSSTSTGRHFISNFLNKIYLTGNIWLILENYLVCGSPFRKLMKKVKSLLNILCVYSKCVNPFLEQVHTYRKACENSQGLLSFTYCYFISNFTFHLFSHWEFLRHYYDYKLLAWCHMFSC